MKYTGRMPSTTSSASRPQTPSFQGLGFRQRTTVRGSPLPSPSRFIQQQGGMEAIFQGAAKGVLERGQKLGINQAMQSAMGEIRRNVQGFQEARMSPRAAKDMLATDTSAQNAVARINKRNKQLARMLDETVGSLKSLATSSLEDRVKTLELIEIAAAKVQFVQVYLEDPTMEMPDSEAFGGGASRRGEEEDEHERQDVAMEAGSPVFRVTSPTTPNAGAEATAAAISALSLVDQPSATIVLPSPTKVEDVHSIDAMDTSADHPADTAPAAPAAPKEAVVTQRPKAPVPTRSTLAQSSFSWMLEPDVPTSTASLQAAAPTTKSYPTHRKRASGNASRERNAFLFGEITASESGEQKPITSEEIFGLEPIRKPSASSSKERQAG
jgi:TBC1 domain family member 5